MKLFQVVLICSLLVPLFAWLDYYAILKVSKSVTKQELKRAFRQRALELHPDKNSKPDAEVRFRELVEGKKLSDILFISI